VPISVPLPLIFFFLTLFALIRFIRVRFASFLFFRVLSRLSRLIFFF
jgi:hypothetical protein